jgi:hypothetical protein
LSAASFAAYPPQAREIAAARLTLLQRLPLAFVPLLLRELIQYDWKFPAERADLDRQFRYLADSPQAVAAFGQLRLTRELEQTDWVNAPAAFSEQLSAHLWATHQIDAFRQAATDYVAKATASAPDAELPTHRLGISVIGQGVARNDYRLFRKLAPQGTHFTSVENAGVTALVEATGRRALAHPAPYGHWYIDGGAGLAAPSGVTAVSYQALAGPRAALQIRMQKSFTAPLFDPEAFRSMLARIQPGEVGFGSKDPVMDRFQLSLLSEGSGTQVFSTTFVQWAAREALRRAQPLTVMARFAPRQRERGMDELLAEALRTPELDPAGSLVDGDMGAWYHHVNQQRLSGADRARFLVWFEGHGEAVAVGPGFARGIRNDERIAMENLISRLV